MKGLCFLLCVLFSVGAHLVSAQKIEQRIQASVDDAEEKFDGSYVTTTSSDIEMVHDSWNDQGLQKIGLRFRHIGIPVNSVISKAYIQFTAEGASSGDVTMNIKGESSANSAQFISSSNNISNRPVTNSKVEWTLTKTWADNQAGLEQRTPDLSSIVSEIIGSNGWKNGNPITFIIAGNGNESELRRAYSYDKNPAMSPELVVEFSSKAEVDLAITSVMLPTEVIYPNADSKVTVEIKSFGNVDAEDYTLSLTLPGKETITESATVPLKLGQRTIFTFSHTADFSELGTNDIKVEVTIKDDEDLSNNSLSKTISVVSEVDKAYFSKGSPWRYVDSRAPGPGWAEEDFYDDLWPVGTGQLGFGQGEQTKLKAGSVSYFFRKKIDFPEMNELNDVYMHLMHDDGAVVYINGKEIFRTEMMPMGSITHNTPARQSCNDVNQNEFYTYKISPGHFVTGVNTIAVSVHNRSGGNTDLAFDCYLTSEFSYSQDGPYVFYNGDKIEVQEVTSTGLVSNTYTSKSEVQLTCSLPHMKKSFSFPLKSSISTEPSEYSRTPSKFLTISDFDGHIEAFTMLLKGEGIIDDDFNWIYEDGHLIITGDLFDRGFHVTECMWLLYKLESEAEAAGGKVHLVIGNHEMFNMTDDWRYVEVKYFNSAQLMGKRMSELHDSSTELGRWLRSKNIMERIGDYAFVHGGLSPEVSSLNLTYDEINNYGRMEMNGTCSGDKCEMVTGSYGVYWYRGMAREELTQQQVDDILDGFDVKRVIMGHTKGSTARSLYNGRVLAIDMYHMDNFSNGFMEALQFELGCFYIFHTDGSDHSYKKLGECDELEGGVLEVNGKDQLQIYPNPAVSSLTIKLPIDLLDKYNYTVVDQQGKVVGNGKIVSELSTIDVSEFAAGKYILTLQNSERTISGHFVLKR